MKATYGRFLAFVFYYPRRAALFVVLLTLLGVLNSIQPYFYKLFVDALPTQSVPTLLTILWVYAAARIGQVVWDIGTNWLGDAVLIASSRDARHAIFQKIQELDFAFHLSRSTGSLISIFKRGDTAFFTLFSDLTNQYLILVQLVVTLIAFGTVDSTIMLLMLATFVISVGLAYLAIHYNISKRRTFNEEEDNISAIIVDNLINYETVKYFGKEERESERLRSSFVSWTSSIWGYANSFRVIDGLVGFSSNLGFFVIVGLSLYRYLHGQINLSDVVLILGMLSSFYPKLFEMVYKFREIAKSYVDIESYFGVLRLKEEVEDPDEPKNLEKVKGEITFEHVSFGYQDGKKNALDDVNLVISPGESVAFVGQSGVGKTTLVKLLLRFFDVKSGRIMLDGLDIRDFDKSTLRSYMGVVPQEPVLFNNTIAFNIGYGLDEHTMADIKRAARMAHLEEFIKGLPMGYETKVGERGVKLSGGQKQRLAIARMILSDPEIIIFDEATSQLDSVSEKYIQESFWKVAKGKTTIIIAHRLSTVVKADRIVVLDKGKIAEVGTHQELLKIKDGIYRHYWELQAKVG